MFGSNLRLTSRKDDTLSFRHLEINSIHELWVKFKKIFLQHPTHGIFKNVLFDCFNKSHNLDKKRMANQIFLGALSRLPYAIAAHLFHNLSILNKQTKKN